MLYVSLAPWVEVTDRIGRTDAESFLTFIAANKEIAKAIEDAQRNYEGHDRYEGFINLLKEVGSDSNRCFEYRSALCDKGISGDWRFQDIINNPPKGETANADADKMGTYLIVYNCLNINGGFGKDYYPPSDKYTSAELHNIARTAADSSYNLGQTCLYNDDGSNHVTTGRKIYTVIESAGSSNKPGTGLCTTTYCEGICASIYGKGQETACADLSVAQVERLLDIHRELFTITSISELKNIDYDDFEEYLEIHTDPMGRHAVGYKSPEAKDFLTWMAQDRKIAKILEDKFSNLIIAFYAVLFSKLDTNIFTALKEDISGSKNFMDLSVGANNEITINAVFNGLVLYDESCYDTKDTNDIADDIDLRKSEGCLKKWCEVGVDMEDSYAQDLLEEKRYSFFERYIVDIIDDGINGDSGTANDDTCTEPSSDSEWNSDQDCEDETDKKGYIGSIRDLNKWWVDLCPSP